jgi:ribose/xylose/arabinose/galactoside ABC-type transport system permease subunit
MQLAGWGTYAQFIVRGLILLGAVTFDEYQKKSRRKPQKSTSDQAPVTRQ